MQRMRKFVVPLAKFLSSDRPDSINNNNNKESKMYSSCFPRNAFFLVSHLFKPGGRKWTFGKLNVFSVGRFYMA